MLRIKSTIKNTGITVSGNYADLNELHNAFLSVIGGDGEYFFEASSRLRVLDVCNDIRLSYRGKRETYKDDYDIPCFAFRVLWPEAAFIAAVLDNFVLLSAAKKLYVNRLPYNLSNEISTVSSDHIALIHYFQDLVWNELERFVGDRQVRAIFGEYNDMRSMHFKYPQLDGFCTQWLDLLNIKYLCSKSERRSSYLTRILTSLFSVDEEYLVLKNSIKVFAEQEGIRLTGVRVADYMFPDNIEW